MSKRVALVGRPNVGKSTLFNRLARSSIAIVHETPGVTRDWQERPVRFEDLEFTLIDTAGLFDPDTSDLTKSMFEKTKEVVAKADLLLFMIDAAEGVTPYDKELFYELRKLNKPLIVIAHKVEGKVDENELYTLGLKDFVSLSSKTGFGFYDLYEKLLPYLKDGVEDKDDIKKEEDVITFAIVGRPNAGKSTLINSILKENRLLTGSTPGITRDAITIPFTWKKKAFRLVDTAGLRKRARVVEHLEKLAGHDTMESIKYAQAVALVIDPMSPLEKQDLTIAKHVLDEGRILLLIINKKDLIEDRSSFEKDLTYRLSHTLSQAKGLKKVYVSALHDKAFDGIFEELLTLYKGWNQKVSTSQLNKWLEATTSHHPPPMSGRGRIKIRYMTQIKTRPPSFVFFINKPKDLPDSYLKYLEGQLRKNFGFEGVPLRLWLRKGENPYAPS